MNAPLLRPASAPFSEADRRFMQRALELADQAERDNEVPVGAVLVHQGQVIGEGYNRTITLNDPTAHAEVLAMRAAGQVKDNYRLPGTTLYVTLEPCMMCAGAMIHARVERLVFAAIDPKTGAAGGRFSLLEGEQHNHQLTVESGLLADEAGAKLKAFFKRRR